MKINFNIKRELKITAALAVLFFFIAFSERKQGTVSVKDIIIKVDNANENQFLDEKDIVRLMQLDEENLKGASLDRLNLKDIEKRIKAHRFVEVLYLHQLICKQAAHQHHPSSELIRDWHDRTIFSNVSV